MNNVEQTIISQYANSPTICAIVQGMNEWIDPQSDIQSFFDYVWNVETAQGFGLDIWGKIVGVSRDVTIDADLEYFGFDTGVVDSQPFGAAPFWSGTPDTMTFLLGDTAFRKLILAKAMANIIRCVTPAVNQLLQNLFNGRGRCYVTDLGTMRMRYNFEFFLLPYEVVIVDQLNVLPRPAGVLQEASQIIYESFLGFIEMGDGVAPFGEAVFFPEN